MISTYHPDEEAVKTIERHDISSTATTVSEV